MEYNTQRENMVIPEYGRNIQKMIEHSKTIADKEERNKAAQAIVNIMALLNPQVKEIDDYQHKLWDHLFIISNYELDVDAPYKMPDPNELKRKPDRLEYSSNHIKYRYYGKNVERMIKAGLEMEEGPKKDAFLNQLAAYMRMAYRMWNEEKVMDDVIIGHLEEMSGGKLKIDSIQGHQLPQSHYRQQHKGGSQQGGGGYKRQGGKKNYRKKY